jgi:uncharacterized protein YegJ (DUF2314 family)
VIYHGPPVCPGTVIHGIIYRAMISRCLLVLALLTAAGCDQRPAIAPAEPPLSSTPDGSAWRSLDGSERVATPPMDPDLAAAIREARSTADVAMAKWASGSRQARTRWAVKWAAPTSDGGVEHVWVQPTSWTVHRIEGWLASPPQSPLACGRVQGELVSFPAEALSDWARFSAGSREHPAEGGFSIRVLEARYGRPE